MDLKFRQRFIDLWDKYFHKAELPIVFYYANDELIEAYFPAKGSHCIINELNRVRAGAILQFTSSTIGCVGGKRYLGFTQKMGPKFEYFLSCGIPGEMEGERYKKDPALVREHMQSHPTFTAPGKSIVFKRWDTLTDADLPQVVIFYATPDVLSGLFTLANFDESDPQAVITPMGSGCAAIVDYPYHEGLTDHPRPVLGMFDVSARPWVPPDFLTLAVPWSKFVRMVDNMDNSFLITPSWAKVLNRISGQPAFSEK